MRATYRRERKTDPLASVEAVRSVIEQLRSILPEIIPKRDKDLVKLLRAVRHVNRYRATDTKRGRPSRWKREELLSVGARLSAILERETSSHLSLSSFVDHYLRLLDFPADVVEALSSGQINLFEAEQLARITPERLQVSPAQAKRMRAEMLSTHRRPDYPGKDCARGWLRFFELHRMKPKNLQKTARHLILRTSTLTTRRTCSGIRSSS